MQPYQIFFPLGLAYGIAGVSFWILFALGWMPYPGIPHAHFMIDGFLLSFVTGFLLTAAPRFLGTQPRSPFVTQLMFFLSVEAFAWWLGEFSLRWVYLPVTLGFLTLMAYLASQFRARRFSPPPGMIFGPIGLLSGAAGAGILLFSDLGILSNTHVFLGRWLLHQAVILCLMLGIGSRLVTMLLGWGQGPLVQIGKDSGAGRERKAVGVALASVLLAIGAAIAGRWELARALEGAAALSIALPLWRLHRLPRAPGRLAFWLWAGAWALVGGLLLQAAKPEWWIHALHLTFIGGYGMMTLMVASRVTLAHGGYDTDIELKSKALVATGMLLLLSAATRFSAPFIPGRYISHLGYAAATWTVAALIWGATFVPRIWGPALRELRVARTRQPKGYPASS